MWFAWPRLPRVHVWGAGGWCGEANEPKHTALPAGMPGAQQGAQLRLPGADRVMDAC